jgi:apolipoprotein N-acyltransferase
MLKRVSDMRHRLKKIEKKLSARKWSDWGSRLGACVLAGCMWFLACADFDIWPLAWLAMVPALWALRGTRPRKAFLLAGLAGLVANAGGFYWIVGLLERFGNLPTVAAVPLYLLLCAYQALVFAFWGMFLRMVQRRHPLGAVWVGAVLMVALELVVPFVFPWYLAITQAWVVPVIQIAELTGPLGVTFLLLMFNGVVYDMGKAWMQGKALPWKTAAIPAAAVLAGTLVFGQIRIHQVSAARQKAPRIKIGVVQGNVGIDVKGQPGFQRRQLQLHRELSRQLVDRGAALIVWPESSYPYPLSRELTHDAQLKPAALRVLQGFSGPIVFGAVTVDWKMGEREPARVYNTAICLDEAGKHVGKYDKIFLLIFGEYIPFYESLDFMKQFFQRHRMSNFQRGEKLTTFPLSHRGERYKMAPLICYEDILPGLTRKMAAFEPNLFVNITNDAWFGETSEPYQHLALAVYRSVEHRLAMVRAVNTGVSAIIDPTGRVVHATPAMGSCKEAAPRGSPAAMIRATGLEKRAEGVWQAEVWPYSHVLLGNVALMEHSSTLYALAGDWFGYLNLVLSLYLLIVFRRNLGKKLFKPKGMRKSKNKPK